MPNVSFIREDVKDAKEDWQLIDDCVAGERVIKSKKSTYLPIPGTEMDANQREERYKSYIGRAMFYNVTGRTLDGLEGQVFSKETEIGLPGLMERYEEDIDGAGTSIEQQSKVALRTALSKGHGGLLADFPAMGREITRADLNSGLVRPRIMLIQPDRIINWRTTLVGGEDLLTLLVLHEDKVIEDDGFEYETEDRWRVYELMGLGNEQYGVRVTVYKESADNSSSAESFIAEEPPRFLSDLNGNPIRRIPFEFIGSTNNEPTIDKSPMLDLARMNIAHYRNSADYEESLYIVGQPTLVISGLTQQWVNDNINGKVILGSRSAVSLPKDAKAEILQPHPNIMPKEGMAHKEEQMKALGAKLIEPNFSKITATEVLMEAASESSILTSTANNVSTAYRKAVAHAGNFIMVIEPDDVVFQLNTDFSVDRMTAQERQQLITEYQSGLMTFGEARENLRTAGLVTESNEVAKLEAEEMTKDLNGNPDDA